MMRKLFYISSLIVLLFAICFYYLFETNRGLQTTINLARLILPGQLSVASAKGRLFKNLVISDFSYDSKETHFHFNYLEIDWHGISLFRKVLMINRLNLNNVYLKMGESKEPIDWRHIHLPITLHLNNININNAVIVSGSLKPITIQRLFLIANSHKNTLMVKQFSCVTDTMDIRNQGYLTIRAPFNSRFSGTAIYSIRNYQPILFHYGIQGDAKNLKAFLSLSLQEKSSHSKGQGVIEIELSDLLGAQKINGQAHWNQLSVPYEKKEVFSSHKGFLMIEGTLKDYELKLKTDLKGARSPLMEIDVSGHGTDQGLKLKSIALSLLNGSLIGQARVDWQKSLFWQAELRATHLDPSQYWPVWSGDVNFNVFLKGQEGAFNLVLSNLYGQMNRIPFVGKVAIDKTKNHYHVQEELTLGHQGYVILSGYWGEKIHLTYSVKLQDLKKLTKIYQGSLFGKGAITGTLKAPIVHANLSINHLSLKNLSIVSLNLIADMDATEKLNLFFLANQVSFLDRKAEQIKATITGTKKSHQLFAFVRSTRGDLDLLVNGRYEDAGKIWKGVVQRFDANSIPTGFWQLKKPVSLEVSKAKRQIAYSPFCLVSGRSGICSKGYFYSSKKWQFSFDLHHINLALLKDFMPESVSFNTDINGGGAFLSNNGKAKGGFDLSINQALLSYITQKQKLNFNFSPGFLKGQFSSSGLGFTMKVSDLKQGIGFNANLLLPRYYGEGFPSQTAPIAGHLDANIRSISLLNVWLPFLQNITGMGKANIDLSGSLSQPLLSGKVVVDQGGFGLSQYGLVVNKVLINAVFNKTSEIALSGSLNSGSGDLLFRGKTYLNSGFSPLLLKMTGQKVLVYNKSGYTVYANPNLEINYDYPNWYFKGEMTIPSAQIAPKDFTSTVSLPDNIIILDGKNATQNTLIPLFMNVKVNMGDQISVQYAGLNTGLSGSVVLNKIPESGFTGTGKLKAVEGYYQAYGQRLNIATGDLLFTGGSIFNPQINILATKKIQSTQVNDAYLNLPETIVVGIRVIGTMTLPKISFYSSPTMPTSNILSYLLFGQDSSGLSSANLQVLSQSASSMGISPDGVINSIKNQLKLTEFGIQSGQIYDPQTQQLEQNTSLVLGKQLSKRLSLSYSIGILVPVNVLRAIYSLSKHWSLQSDASAFGSGADIIYTIQTD